MGGGGGLSVFYKESKSKIQKKSGFFWRGEGGWGLVYMNFFY